VVNLAGRSINCRHTPENLREITESRVNPVRAIAAAICHVKQPPRVWVQAGAVGYYGDCRDQWCDELFPNGKDPLAEVCRLWENAFHAADTLHTRRVLFRIGLVLGSDGGALPMLANLTKWFLGGAAGNGKQYISWIHLADLIQMFLQAIEPDKLSGRHLQRRSTQSGNQCGIHARAAAQLLSSVVPAGSRLDGKTHITADAYRTVAHPEWLSLRAKTFSGIRFRISIPGPARRVEKSLPDPGSAGGMKKQTVNAITPALRPALPPCAGCGRARGAGFAGGNWCPTPPRCSRTAGSG
jgi:hypothetical protein